MASSDVIKQKIVLEGEQEYSNALKSAQRNLKTLQSALKAETAELAKNGTEQQKAEARTKNLQKQIAEQEKIVKTYQKALEEVREKYGENEEAVAKWEVKLNNARTTLANMQNSLADVGKGVATVNAEAQNGVQQVGNFAESFGRLSGIGDTVSGAIEDIFSGMLNTVRKAAEEVWQLITETAAKADRWSDLAGYYGSTAEEVQAYDRAIQGAGGSFEDLLSMLNLLEFKGKDKKAKDWLGISDVNYTNQLEYASQVMTKLAEKREKLGAAKFNDQFAEAFGGKASGYLELISKWGDVLDKKKQYGEMGYLITQDEIETMAGVQGQLAEIETKWDMLKTKFGEGFGSVTMSIMTNVSGALDALAKYFNAESPEERETALKELKENITEAFTKMAEAIREGLKILDEVAEELKTSEDPIVSSIGKILGAIVDALEWLTEDNGNNAIKVLETIAAFWITGNGLKMGSKIAGILADLRLIKNLKSVADTGGGGGGGGSGAPTTTGSAPVVANTGGGGGSGWSNLLGSLGFVAASAWATWKFGQFMEKTTYENQWGAFNEHEAAQAGQEIPLLLQQIHDAAVGIDDDPNMDRMSLAKELFMQYGNEFYKDNPDMQFWRSGELAGYLEDGQLTNEELREIVENDLVPVADDWEELMRGLYNKYSETDIPADWWKGEPNQDGVTSQDVQNLNHMPEDVKAAVESLIGSININMDGEKVADLLTDRVSERIAAAVEP